MHIRFRSTQMEITKLQFRTNCVLKWLVCISARHVVHVFASVPYNAPVRVYEDEEFAKVNESPIFYEAKWFMITNIRFGKIAR